MPTSIKIRILILLILPHLFYFIIFPQNGDCQEVSLINTSTYISSGRFEWKVSVVANGSTLDSIRSVEYTLHPSFSNPVVLVTNRQTNFALKANGWGEFYIYAKILYRDGRVERKRHWLILRR